MNSPKPTVTVEHGGTIYTLVLDLAAIMAIEERADQPIGELLETAAKSRRVAPVVTLIWGALQRHHPMTFEAATEWVSDIGLDTLGAKLQALVGTTAPDAEDVTEVTSGAARARPRRAQTARPAGTGAASTARPAATA